MHKVIKGLGRLGRIKVSFNVYTICQCKFTLLNVPVFLFFYQSICELLQLIPTDAHLTFDLLGFEMIVSQNVISIYCFLKIFASIFYKQDPVEKNIFSQLNWKIRLGKCGIFDNRALFSSELSNHFIYYFFMIWKFLLPQMEHKVLNVFNQSYIDSKSVFLDNFHFLITFIIIIKSLLALNFCS